MSTLILIVVEHDILRETLAMWLTATFPQCHIRAASNEAEAIALARTNLPRLIVLDTGLSEARSFEAIKRLRELLPTTPVLVLTGYDSGIYRRHALACGATACYMKEAILTELRPMLAALLASAVEANGDQQTRPMESDPWPKQRQEF